LNRPKLSTLNIRISVLIAGLLIPTGLSHAQLFLGVSGALNSSSFVGDNRDKQSYESVSSIAASLILEYRIARDINISLQPGYVQNGTIVSYEDPRSESGSRDSLSVHMESLSLPLLVRVLTKGRWFVNSGPVFWYTSKVSTRAIETGEELDFVGDYNAWDAGLVFGFGKFFQIKNFRPFVEFRVVWGVTNLVQDNSEGVRVRHTGKQLSVGTIYSL